MKVYLTETGLQLGSIGTRAEASLDAAAEDVGAQNPLVFEGVQTQLWLFFHFQSSDYN